MPLGCEDAYTPVLGVKGSPVQIRPSRRVFRTLVPRIGNENCHDRSHLTGRDESNQGSGQAILMTAPPRWPTSRDYAQASAQQLAAVVRA